MFEFVSGQRRVNAPDDKVLGVFFGKYRCTLRRHVIGNRLFLLGIGRDDRNPRPSLGREFLGVLSDAEECNEGTDFIQSCLRPPSSPVL